MAKKAICKKRSGSKLLLDRCFGLLLTDVELDSGFVRSLLIVIVFSGILISVSFTEN